MMGKQERSNIKAMTTAMGVAIPGTIRNQIAHGDSSRAFPAKDMTYISNQR